MATIDFTLAQSQHSTWKSRLRSFLDGKAVLTEQEATSHKDCSLGKWMYSEGLEKYKSVPEMRVLETKHTAMHSLVKSIVRFKQGGDQLAAEKELVKLNQFSTDIINLLEVMKKKV